jgi:hypothetical protein
MLAVKRKSTTYSWLRSSLNLHNVVRFLGRRKKNPIYGLPLQGGPKAKDMDGAFRGLLGNGARTLQSVSEGKV